MFDVGREEITKMKGNLNELLSAVFQVLKRHEAAIETYGEVIGDTAVAALAALESCGSEGCKSSATQKCTNRRKTFLCDYHLAERINAGQTSSDDWVETDVADAVRALSEFQDAHEAYSSSTTLH